LAEAIETSAAVEKINPQEYAEQLRTSREQA